MRKIIIAVAFIVALASGANAQSPVCKGKAEADCATTQVNGVTNLCGWIKPRAVMKDTGMSEIKGYCRVKLRTITPDEAKKLSTTASN